jgi:hypothetical protein
MPRPAPERKPELETEMNNLAYSSKDPQKVGPQVEELIRKELGAAGPLAYTVADGAAEPYTVGSALKAAVIGGRLESVFQLNFELPSPRPARLEISMCQFGIGCLAGSTLYSSHLSKSVNGEVGLGEPAGIFSSNSKFVGDPEASARLNANGDLLKLANKFARTESTFGGSKLKRERLLKIVQNGQGSVLIVGSLPRTVSMGFSATVDSKDFFELATLIEQSL